MFGDYFNALVWRWYNKARLIENEGRIKSMNKQSDIKLGLFSYSYHLAFGAHEVFTPSKKMNLYQFIDKAKNMGLDGIQVDAMHLQGYDDEYITNLRSYAEACGLYLEYGITGIAEEHLLRHLEIAKRLGASVMRTYLGFNPRAENVNVPHEVERAAMALNAVKHKAQLYGVQIAVENHCDLTTDELLGLMTRVNSPNVGVCVDLGNFMIHLENPVDSVKKLVPYIISTHFKDYAFSMENWGFKAYGVALGDGVIDLRTILDILIDEAHLDRITLEIPVEQEATEVLTLKKEDDLVRTSVIYAREVLGIN
jgi:sugar phosphate isomerase/epimerase